MSGNKPRNITEKTIERLIEKRTKTYDPLKYEKINKTINTLRKNQSDTTEANNKLKYLKRDSSNPTFSPPPQRKEDSSR